MCPTGGAIRDFSPNNPRSPACGFITRDVGDIQARCKGFLCGVGLGGGFEYFWNNEMRDGGLNFVGLRRHMAA